MRKLKETDIISDYSLFKKCAKQHFQKQNYEACFKFISICSNIAYTFNFVFLDLDLEELLIQLGNKLIKNEHLNQGNDRLVFYDYFGIENRGLTQQYIRGLKDLDKEFLYILDGAGSMEKSNRILDEIRSYKKASVYTLKETTFVGKLKEVEKVVNAYQPSQAMLHLAPWDVVGVTFWNTYKITRYFINLTDHAFWLGVNCADYFIEFRLFGYKLSVEARGIAKSKLLLLPYYPIQTKTRFLGFPTDISGKVVGFSGAAFYKIYGRGGLFLRLIKRALIENNEFIFLLAGSGNELPLKKFIKDNGFEDRFILIGNRHDINEVLQNIDIYINTFPFGGCLMSQLAVVNNKPLITYTTPDLAFNFIENFLKVDKTKVSSMLAENEFITELNQLIKSKAYRDQNVINYKGSVPTIAEFNERLRLHLEQNLKEEIFVEDIQIDYNAIKELYLEVENDFVKGYDYQKLIQLGSSYFSELPVAAVKSLLYVLNFHGVTILKKTFKKLLN